MDGEGGAVGSVVAAATAPEDFGFGRGGLVDGEPGGVVDGVGFDVAVGVAVASDVEFGAAVAVGVGASMVDPADGPPPARNRSPPDGDATMTGGSPIGSAPRALSWVARAPLPPGSADASPWPRVATK